MWTTAVNVDQGNNEDIYDNEDDADKADLVLHKIMHL
jgi:hypothetical protein